MRNLQNIIRRTILKIFGYNHIHDENNKPDREPFTEGANFTPDGTESKKAKMLSPKDAVTLLAAFILFCASGIVPLPFALLFAVAAAPLYTAFSAKMGNRFSFLPPVAAFIVSIIITRSAASSAGVFLAAGMAFAMLGAVCKNPENPKTSAVIASTVVCLLYAALTLLLFMLENGIETEQLKQAFEQSFNSLKEIFIQIYGSIDFSAFDIEISESELAAAAEQMAFQVKTLFPAICVIYGLLISYISASLLRPAAKLLKAESMFDGKLYEISLSPFAVVVYFISSLGMMLFGGSAAYGLRNVTYILAPGFMLCGIKQIGAFLKGKGIPPMGTAVIQLAAVSLSVMFGNLGVTLLIILGMFYTTKIPTSKNK